jgi:hypothetical protein
VHIGEATYSGWKGEAGPVGAWLNPALLPGTMAIQGISSLTTALRIKLMEVLMFHVCGTGSPSSVVKRTHPGRHTWVTQ